MIAALIPIVVFTTSCVNGMTVAISTRNGRERPRLAIQLIDACTVVCGVSPRERGVEDQQPERQAERDDDAHHDADHRRRLPERGQQQRGDSRPGRCGGEDHAALLTSAACGSSGSSTSAPATLPCVAWMPRAANARSYLGARQRALDAHGHAPRGAAVVDRLDQPGQHGDVGVELATDRRQPRRVDVGALVAQLPHPRLMLRRSLRAAAAATLARAPSPRSAPPRRPGRARRSFPRAALPRCQPRFARRPSRA